MTVSINSYVDWIFSSYGLLENYLGLKRNIVSGNLNQKFVVSVLDKNLCELTMQGSICILSIGIQIAWLHLCYRRIGEKQNRNQ
jgi:hypothetical protein